MDNKKVKGEFPDPPSDYKNSENKDSLKIDHESFSQILRDFDFYIKFGEKKSFHPKSENDFSDLNLIPQKLKDLNKENLKTFSRLLRGISVTKASDSTGSSRVEEEANRLQEGFLKSVSCLNSLREYQSHQTLLCDIKRQIERKNGDVLDLEKKLVEMNKALTVETNVDNGIS